MKFIKNKKILIVFLLIIVIAVVLFIFNSKESQNNEEISSQNTPTTSQEPSAQPDYVAESAEKQQGNTVREDQGSANIQDTNGSNVRPTSNPIVSKSGSIKLYSPAANSQLSPDSVISGESNLNKISYRLIDNRTGVISVGELTVVEGKFSGKISFTTQATEGRLDIFGTQADGTEIDNIEVNVRFN